MLRGRPNIATNSFIHATNLPKMFQLGQIGAGLLRKANVLKITINHQIDAE